MKSRPIASAGILLLFCGLGLAQSQQDALDVLNKVGDTYRSVKTLQAEADVQTDMSTQGMQQKLATHLLLTLGTAGKFRMETKTGPARVLMIADGQTIWAYFPELNKYSKLPVSRDSHANALAPAGLPGLGGLPDFAKVGEGVKEARMLPSETLQLDGVPTDCYVISILHQPQQGSSKAVSTSEQPSSETLWVDKARLLVVRLSSDTESTMPGSTAPTETKATITFSKLTLDDSVPDDAFVFTPPSGATELDLKQFMSDQLAPQ